MKLLRCSRAPVGGTSFGCQLRHPWFREIPDGPHSLLSVCSYVSAMVPVKSPREYYVQQEVIVLFCETVER